MDTTIKDRLARMKESTSQRIARLQQSISTTPDETEQPEPSERESRQIRMDPDIQAQMNLSTAMSLSRLSGDALARSSQEDMDTYDKVFDPRAFFIRQADDRRRKPGQSDSSYQRSKIAQAERRLQRFLKKYPEHSKGRIDRYSVQRKTKRNLKVERPMKKTSAKAKTGPYRKRPMPTNKWTHREVSQALIINNQFAVIEYLLDKTGFKYTTTNYKRVIARAVKARNKREAKT